MSRYKINKGFIFQTVGKKITIFDGEESVLYTFNETASYIFKLLKKGLKQSEIADMLAKKFNISNSKAQKDTQELITDFLKKKIIL
jgi:hypothetical protein